jgi:hypothetical protein
MATITVILLLFPYTFTQISTIQKFLKEKATILILTLVRFKSWLAMYKGRSHRGAAGIASKVLPRPM